MLKEKPQGTRRLFGGMPEIQTHPARVSSLCDALLFVLWVGSIKPGQLVIRV